MVWVGSMGEWGKMVGTNKGVRVRMCRMMRITRRRRRRSEEGEKEEGWRVLRMRRSYAIEFLVCALPASGRCGTIARIRNRVVVARRCCASGVLASDVLGENPFSECLVAGAGRRSCRDWSGGRTVVWCYCNSSRNHCQHYRAGTELTQH